MMAPGAAAAAAAAAGGAAAHRRAEECANAGVSSVCSCHPTAEELSASHHEANLVGLALLGALYMPFLLGLLLAVVERVKKRKQRSDREAR